MPAPSTGRGGAELSIDSAPRTMLAFGITYEIMTVGLWFDGSVLGGLSPAHDSVIFLFSAQV
jgi:hypothetical protein